MLSTDRKFLFVHIPKTGGNSIQNVIRSYFDDQVVCITPYLDGVERFEVRSARFNTHKRSTLADYLREYGSQLFASLFKFTCVRNPWDRAVSFYFSPHRGKVVWEREDFGSSRITSSMRRFRILSRCCAKGISVRTLMRGRLAAGIRPEPSGALRSVALIRIARLRPSGNLTTTKAAPRPERSPVSASRWPNSECCESVTVTSDTTRSRMTAF
jgi:Sulfotransferase family